jgi:hypothetical protein
MSVINYTKAREGWKVKRNAFGKYVCSIRVHFSTLYNEGNIRADQTTKHVARIPFSNAAQRDTLIMYKATQRELK